MEKYTVLETNAVLSLACMIVWYIFSIPGFLVASFVFLVLGLFLQKLGELVARGWLGFGEKIGHFVSSLLLSLCFYFFLTPISFLYRLFQGDTLGLKKAQDKDSSYFHDRNVQFNQRYFEKIW